VFIMLWPEYSTNALLPRLRKMLSSILDLLPGSPHASSEEFVQSTRGAS